MNELTQSQKRILIQIGIPLLGIWIIIKSFQTVMIGFESKQWPTIPGEIQSLMIKDYYAGPKSKLKHRVYITYSYEVNGVTYESDRISYGSKPSAFDKLSKANTLLSELKKRPKTRVYYDPDNPREAVLYPGYSLVDPVLLGMGVFFLFFPVLLWATSYRF